MCLKCKWEEGILFSINLKNENKSLNLNKSMFEILAVTFLFFFGLHYFIKDWIRIHCIVNVLFMSLCLIDVNYSLILIFGLYVYDLLFHPCNPI